MNASRLTVALILLALIAPALAEAPKLVVSPGAKGLEALTWNGATVLADGEFKVARAVFEKADGATYTPNDKPAVAAGTRKHPFVTLTYPWGVVSCAYQGGNNRLDLTIAVENTSQDTLREIHLTPLVLALPGELNWPRIFDNAFGQMGVQRTQHNVEQPTIIPVRSDAGMAVLVNLDPTGPLTVSLGSGKTQAITVQSGGDKMIYDEVYVRRPIAPGKTDTYRLSLRLGSPNADPLDLAQDVCDAWAQAYPMTLDWPDRRPIKRLFPGGGLTEAEAVERAKDLEAATAADTLDPKFREMMLKKAAATAQSAKEFGAQGIILWEIEGNKIGKITYVGDPRHTRWLNPQMDLVADEFWKVISDAGLLPGVCLRPSRVIYNAEKSTVQHSYGAAKPPFEELDDKIQYAKDRWGCKLFYIDTNGVYRPRGKDEAWSWGLLAPEVWRKLSLKHPDVLIIPELGSTRYYANSSCYSEMDMGSRGTPEVVRRIWPKAFGCLQLEDDDPVRKHDIIVDAVAKGDILMANAGSERTHVSVQGAYKEAEFRKQTPPKHAPRSTEEVVRGLGDPDSHVRWATVVFLGLSGPSPAFPPFVKNDPAIVDALIKLLDDPEYAVRKSAVRALGASGNPKAVEPLAKVLANEKAYLDYIAADALAKFGDPAVDVLAPIATAGGRGHSPRAAVLALGNIGGDKAAATLVEIANNPKSDWGLKRDALYPALGRVGTEAAATALIEHLRTQENPYLRGSAADALSRTGDPRAAKEIEAAIAAEKAREKPDGHNLGIMNSALSRAKETQAKSE